jgi:hypothetical protein
VEKELALTTSTGLIFLAFCIYGRYLFVHIDDLCNNLLINSSAYSWSCPYDYGVPDSISHKHGASVFHSPIFLLCLTYFILQNKL